jgi:hypothetical protein
VQVRPRAVRPRANGGSLPAATQATANPLSSLTRDGTPTSFPTWGAATSVSARLHWGGAAASRAASPPPSCSLASATTAASATGPSVWVEAESPHPRAVPTSMGKRRCSRRITRFSCTGAEPSTGCRRVCRRGPAPRGRRRKRRAAGSRTAPDASPTGLGARGSRACWYSCSERRTRGSVVGTRAAAMDAPQELGVEARYSVLRRCRLPGNVVTGAARKQHQKPRRGDA